MRQPVHARRRQPANRRRQNRGRGRRRRHHRKTAAPRQRIGEATRYSRRQRAPRREAGNARIGDAFGQHQPRHRQSDYRITPIQTNSLALRISQWAQVSVNQAMMPSI